MKFSSDNFNADGKENLAPKAIVGIVSDSAMPKSDKLDDSLSDCGDLDLHLSEDDLLNGDDEDEAPVPVVAEEGTTTQTMHELPDEIDTNTKGDKMTNGVGPASPIIVHTPDKPKYVEEKESLDQTCALLKEEPESVEDSLKCDIDVLNELTIIKNDLGISNEFSNFTDTKELKVSVPEPMLVEESSKEMKFSEDKSLMEVDNAATSIVNSGDSIEDKTRNDEEAPKALVDSNEAFMEVDQIPLTSTESTSNNKEMETTCEIDEEKLALKIDIEKPMVEVDKEKPINEVIKYKSVDKVVKEECTDEVEKEKCMGKVDKEKCMDEVVTGKCLDEVEKEKCMDEVVIGKCMDEVDKEKCMDEVDKEKCMDEVVTEKCMDEVVTEKCMDKVVKEKCMDEVVTEKCMDEVVTEKCMDEVVTEKCMDKVVKEKCMGEVDKEMAPDVNKSTDKEETEAVGIEEILMDGAESEISLNEGTPSPKTSDGFVDEETNCQNTCTGKKLKESIADDEIGTSDSKKDEKMVISVCSDEEDALVVSVPVSEAESQSATDEGNKKKKIADEPIGVTPPVVNGTKRRAEPKGQKIVKKVRVSEEIKEQSLKEKESPLSAKADSGKGSALPESTSSASTNEKSLYEFYPDTSLTNLTKNALQELIMQKFCDFMVNRGAIGELRQKCAQLEEEHDRLNKINISLKKQLMDTRHIIKRLIEDRIALRESETFMPNPLKVTRSVGLQVCTCGSFYIRPRAEFKPTVDSKVIDLDAPESVSSASKKTASTPTPSAPTPTPTPTPIFVDTSQKSKGSKTSPTETPAPSTMKAQRPAKSQAAILTPLNTNKIVTSSTRTPPPHSPVSTPPGNSNVKHYIIATRPLNTPTSQNSAQLSQVAEVNGVVNIDEMEVIDLTDKDEKTPSGPVNKRGSNTALIAISSNSAISVSNNGVVTSNGTLVGSSNKIVTLPNSGVLTVPNASGVLTVPNGSTMLSVPTEIFKGVQDKPPLKSGSIARVSYAFPPAGNASNKEGQTTSLHKTQASKTYGRKPSYSIHGDSLVTKGTETPAVRTEQNLDNSLMNSFVKLPPLPAAPKYHGPSPPRPNLRICKSSSGIMLSWNFGHLNIPTKIATYQLFAYQERSDAAAPKVWKKVGDVNALPLPMACTLTQFVEGHKYHFAVRAVDVHDRIGEFSSPGSIMLTVTEA